MSWGSRTRKCEITIDHTQVPSGGPGSKWPMLLSYDTGSGNLPAEPLDSDGSYPAKSDGGDLMVATDSNGSSRIALEVVDWSPDNNPAANATAELWAADPDGIWEPSSVSDTSLWIGYGDASASQPAADASYGSEEVWDANYVGVWHLTDANDSTSNDNDGAVSGATSGATGKIGDAYEFDGSSDYINVGNAASLQCDAITVECWFDWDADGNSIITKGESRGGSAQRDWDIYSNGTNLYFLVSNGSSNILVVGRSDPSTGVWTYVAGKWDGTTGADGGAIYIGGDGTTTGTASATNNANTHNVYLGGYNPGHAYEYDGTLDEVRISDTDRSNAWLDCNYANQNTPGTFASAGAPEDTGSATIIPLVMRHRMQMGVS